MPIVVLIRMIRPWLLVRVGVLESRALGHFAGDTEVYLCERDAGINGPGRRHVDLFCIHDLVCNRQLEAMWKRILHIWPNWILLPVLWADRWMPGDKIPPCGNNTQGERDVHNLLDRIPPHLKFSPDEEARGTAGLLAVGIPEGRPFVCLNVRDNAWNARSDLADPSSYDNEQSYRDSDVQDYVLAAETLADRGYVVVRVGAVVREAIRTRHPRVIDYATNGKRSEFMDIYLGAKCEFCLSVGSGFDSVPMLFRRPIAFVNFVPLGHVDSYSAKFISIAKHYHEATSGRELTLAEIFARGVDYLASSAEYRANGIRLVDNTPEEIRDVAVEMAERLNGTWQSNEEDIALQKRFWEVIPRAAPENARDYERGRPWHGEIRSRFGAAFLRANRAWLN